MDKEQKAVESPKVETRATLLSLISEAREVSELLRDRLNPVLNPAELEEDIPGYGGSEAVSAVRNLVDHLNDTVSRLDL